MSLNDQKSTYELEFPLENQKKGIGLREISKYVLKSYGKEKAILEKLGMSVDRSTNVIDPVL